MSEASDVGEEARLRMGKREVEQTWQPAPSFIKNGTDKNGWKQINFVSGQKTTLEVHLRASAVTCVLLCDSGDCFHAVLQSTTTCVKMARWKTSLRKKS